MSNFGGPNEGPRYLEELQETKARLEGLERYHYSNDSPGEKLEAIRDGITAVSKKIDNLTKREVPSTAKK